MPDGTTDVAPDGSPVAFYRRLPPAGEPELIHASIPAGATVLDLGCGPGRIAGPLAALGHAVTGVDNGEGMVAALPPGVEGVAADARSVRPPTLLVHETRNWESLRSAIALRGRPIHRA